MLLLSPHKCCYCWRLATDHTFTVTHPLKTGPLLEVGHRPHFHSNPSSKDWPIVGGWPHTTLSQSPILLRLAHCWRLATDHTFTVTHRLKTGPLLEVGHRLNFHSHPSSKDWPIVGGWPHTTLSQSPIL